MIHLTGAHLYDDDGEGEPYGVDGNGIPTERRWVGDIPVIVHQEDIPESDITVHRGIRCTTPLRTVIDCAPDLNPRQRAEMESPSTGSKRQPSRPTVKPRAAR